MERHRQNNVSLRNWCRRHQVDEQPRRAEPMTVLERLNQLIHRKAVIECRPGRIKGRRGAQAGAADLTQRLADGAHRTARIALSGQLGKAGGAQHAAPAGCATGKALLGKDRRRHGIPRNGQPATLARCLI